MLIPFNFVKTFIVDNTGAVVVEYVYDSWGNHAVKAEEEFLPLANANPYRYRGYYYDPETGLYYLQTRYYDPEIGRFISQDSIEYADPETINGLNLYAYCGNNPVMNIDPTGSDWASFCNWWSNAWNAVTTWANNTWNTVSNWFSQNWDIVVGVATMVAFAAISIATFGITPLLAGIVSGAVIGAGFGALNAYVNNDNILFGALSGLIVGAFSGLGAGGFVGMLLAGASAASAAFTMSVIGDRVNNRKRDLEKAGVSALTAGIFSFCCSFFGPIFNGEKFYVMFTCGSVFSLIFSSYTFISDFIYDHFIKRKDK